jgi:hypothetical protein
MVPSMFRRDVSVILYPFKHPIYLIPFLLPCLVTSSLLSPLLALETSYFRTYLALFECTYLAISRILYSI